MITSFILAVFLQKRKKTHIGKMIKTGWGNWYTIIRESVFFKEELLEKCCAREARAELGKIERRKWNLVPRA